MSSKPEVGKDEEGSIVEIAERIEEESKPGSRRDLLKGLAGGAAIYAGQEVLPDSWTKPLIESVVLPSHASMTPDDDGNTDEEADACDNEDVEGDGEDDSGRVDGECTDEPD